MKAEKYLEQIEHSECRISNKISEIQRLETMAVNISPHLSEIKVSSTPNPHRAQEVWDRLIDSRNELFEEVESLLVLKREIIQKLEQLPHHEYDVLYRLYVLMESVQHIADVTYYSRQTIHRYKHRGLEKIQKMLDARKDVT